VKVYNIEDDWMKLQDIERFNLVNDSNKVKTNYDLSNKEVYVELYISKEKELCIIGRIDNNYICWCSLTNVVDKEHNEKIFDYIANSEFKAFSQEYKVLGTDKYIEIQKWYRCAITRTLVKGMLWATPFGVYYGLENKEEHGKFFADEVIGFFDELLELCDFRIMEKRYIHILEHYLDALRKGKDYSYYYKMKPLISILEKESYLRICPDEKIRNLYLKCMEECSSLYNRYMTAVR